VGNSGTETPPQHGDLDRDLRESMGVISELRHLLSGALMALSRLRADRESDAALDVVERNLVRLRQMIDAFLEEERLRSGTLDCRPEDTTLGALLDPATRSATALAATKGIELAMHYSGDYLLRVDLDLTRSIVQNLVDNAVQFTDHGRVELAVDERPDEVVIHVRDRCGGISREGVAALFTPLERGGLAIARAAAQAQSGTIGAESIQGQGCHFFVRLPRYVEARRADEAPGAPL
jgi:signal transduction histidine kinase